MDKRVALIGIALIVISFFGISMVVPETLTKLTGAVTQTIVMGPHQISFIPMTLNQTGIVVVVYNASARLNFYFTNSSAFGTLRSYTNSSNRSLAGAATALYGRGVYEGVLNSHNGAFPYFQNFTQANVTIQAYFESNVSLLPQDTYYAIFQNTENSSANVIATREVVTNINSQYYYLGSGELLISALFFIGIGVVIYGVMRKPKVKETKPVLDQAYIDRLYEGVERRGRKVKKGRRVGSKRERRK